METIIISSLKLSILDRVKSFGIEGNWNYALTVNLQFLHLQSNLPRSLFGLSSIGKKEKKTILPVGSVSSEKRIFISSQLCDFPVLHGVTLSARNMSVFFRCLFFEKGI